MVEYERLTREHYKTANSNGISHQLAHARFYILKWDIERTITEKPSKRGGSRPRKVDRQ